MTLLHVPIVVQGIMVLFEKMSKRQDFVITLQRPKLLQPKASRIFLQMYKGNLQNIIEYDAYYYFKNSVYAGVE